MSWCWYLLAGLALVSLPVSLLFGTVSTYFFVEMGKYEFAMILSWAVFVIAAIVLFVAILRES